MVQEESTDEKLKILIITPKDFLLLLRTMKHLMKKRKIPPPEQYKKKMHIEARGSKRVKKLKGPAAFVLGRSC